MIFLINITNKIIFIIFIQFISVVLNDIYIICINIVLIFIVNEVIKNKNLMKFHFHHL